MVSVSLMSRSSLLNIVAAAQLGRWHLSAELALCALLNVENEPDTNV